MESMRGPSPSFVISTRSGDYMSISFHEPQPCWGLWSIGEDGRPTDYAYGMFEFGTSLDEALRMVAITGSVKISDPVSEDGWDLDRVRAGIPDALFRAAVPRKLGARVFDPASLSPARSAQIKVEGFLRRALSSLTGRF